ncbi:MAG: hypothetical protein ACKOUQ_12540 [Aquirufa sp.]
MMKYFRLICFISWGAFAQTGIGTTTPNASAKLEVYSTSKGFLPPRISLTGTLDVSTISSPATGLVIFNTVSAGTTPTNVIPGYYYYDGTKWNQLIDQGSLNSFSGYIPNYAQSNASRVTNVTTSGTTIVSQTITTSGRPVQIIASGDANPLTAGGWCQLQLYRDGIAIGKRLQAESSATNENIPYCLNYIDNPTAGTYTYSVKAVSVPSAFDFGEADGNQITLLELGAWSAGTMPVSKGGTGNSSYTAGSVIFSDGTNLAQNNSNLFWDNSNGKLGIGTSAPLASAILDLTSSTKGLLPPRVALTSKSGTSSPVASPATGLVVYNSATAGSNSDAVSPGYYYFNGTIWTKMDQDGWSSNSSISFSAPSGTTAPSKGANPLVDYVKYRNIGGKDFEVEYNLVQSNAGTGGNGDYLISLPAGLQFDSTYPGQSFYTGAAGFAAMKNKLASAIGDLIVATFHNSATVIPYNATQFRVQTNNWGNSTNTWLFMGYNNYSLVDANTTLKMVFSFRAL